MTSALCWSAPTTFSWDAWAFICMSTEDRLALAVYNRLTAFRDWTTSLANTRHTSWSPLLAASLMDLVTCLGRNWLTMSSILSTKAWSDLHLFAFDAIDLTINPVAFLSNLLTPFLDLELWIWGLGFAKQSHHWPKFNSVMGNCVINARFELVVVCLCWTIPGWRDPGSGSRLTCLLMILGDEWTKTTLITLHPNVDLFLKWIKKSVLVLSIQPRQPSQPKLRNRCVIPCLLCR